MTMRMRSTPIGWTLSMLLLTGCAPEGKDGNSSQNSANETNSNTVSSASAVASIPAAALSGGDLVDDAAFNLLSPFEQYRVANKLMATMYKGIPVAEFFDLEQGLDEPVTVNDGTYFSSLVSQLNAPLSVDQLHALDLHILGSEFVDSEGFTDVEPAFQFSNDRSREVPLARISTYPVSRQGYEQWMAWHLANTILFSPATDLDSASMIDAQNVYRRLVNGISARKTIREIVSDHMRSVENWRRFRSPEDNTREMMEIFLGLENQDADVPKASKACRDLYLTDDRGGYMLSYTDFPNTEPQEVLNSTVVNCDDFYDVVAAHELLIPTVVFDLVRFFYAEHDFGTKKKITERILATNPETFDDVFGRIIFSKEYLLVTERPRSFEEAFLATAEKLRWDVRSDLFRGMASGNGGSSRTYMGEMGWPAMTAKLGRNSGIAHDSLSFANYHKAFREILLIDRRRWEGPLGLTEPEPPQNALDKDDIPLPPEEYDARAELNSQLKRLTIPELVDYLFLSVVGRTTVAGEEFHLISIFDEKGYLRHEEERSYVKDGRMDELAQLTLDYLSRLPETYYFKKDGGI